MNASELIGKTKAYVEASNAHDVDRIATMLKEDVVYQSTGVGRHEGAAAILTMNRSFFGEYPDVHWDAENYRTVDDGGVEFDFVITLGGHSSSGIERVFFDPSGRISRVEVER